MAPQPSQLELTERRYLAELERRSEEAELVLADTYRRSARYIEPLWRDAYRVLEQAQANGASPDYLAGALWQEQRLASILAGLTDAADTLMRSYSLQLEASMYDAGQLAQQSVDAQLRGVLGPTVAAQVPPGMMPADQLKLLTARLADGSPIAAIGATYGPQFTDAVRGALLEGMANGESPLAVARRMAGALGAPYGRMAVLTRTEMLRVYRDTTLATYQANPRLVTGWRWVAAMSTRTCPVCWAMHGTVHPLREKMHTHPCCRCSMVPVLPPDLSHIHPALANVKTPRPVDAPWAMLDGVPAAGRKGPDVFRQLTPESQRTILGPLAFRAYRQGRLELPDLVEDTYSPIWGRGRSQRALGRVLGPDTVRQLRAEERAATPRKPRTVVAPPIRPVKRPITPAPKPSARKAQGPATKPTGQGMGVAPASWRPSMSRDEANAWALQGDLTRPLYHVTSTESAAGISSQGFDLTRSKWGRVWGNGAYMSDSSASESMYSAGLVNPKKLELRVFSRKTLRVDISGRNDWGHNTILSSIPGVDFDTTYATYTRHENEILDARSAFLDELNRLYPTSGAAFRHGTMAERGKILGARQDATDKAIREGRYVEQTAAEAFTRTLQEYGYDALDLVDEPHRSSVGGSQVIVWDPKRVVVVKETP